MRLGLFVLLMSGTVVRTAAAADDWPQFRGPGGEGHSPAVGLPLSWSETENVAWKVAVPGRGWSSPVVLGNHIWMTTALETAATAEEKKQRLAGKKHAETLQVAAAVSLRAICIRRDSGEPARDVELFRIDEPAEIHQLNSYASPTPVLEPGRLYCDFGTCGTACVDCATGKVLWKRRLPIDHQVGPGSSPILHEELLILVRDGCDQQYITAVDKRTGQTVWRTDRPPMDTDDEFKKAFSTPLVFRSNGKRQMIVPGAEWIVSYDPATGEQIWRVDCGRGYSNVPRPVFGHGMVYVCTEFPGQQLWAIAVDGRGDVTDTHVRWKAVKQIPKRSSPLLVGRELYVVSDGGVATCFDALTGRPHWRKRVGGNYFASPVYADGRIYLFNDEGKATLLTPGKEFVKPAENRVEGRIVASPAIADGTIILRTDTHLYRIEKDASRLRSAKMLRDYYQQMSLPKPFVVRSGEEFEAHRRRLRTGLLESTGLWPLPERIALDDVHRSDPLDHPWCTVRRVHYQLWPGVYSSGLLYVPKQLSEKPAPAMLCPHGHCKHGNAYPREQKRCLNFARLGYVTFSSTQNHYEDLYVGVSHQTLMIWNNMRALDYLDTLPGVDKTRIGMAGSSGGGLQTQMITALDTRVKAASIVGLTCQFRKIMFPDRQHCVCNHFPNVMQLTDHPEISTLGLPTPVQYLTMNDWTKTFQQDSFPTIRELYAAAGFPDRVECKYFDTPHNYDKSKREETYRWMEKWVGGRKSVQPVAEPEDVKTFPVETLVNLSAEVPADKGFGEISNIYRYRRGYKTPAIANAGQWQQYRNRMIRTLKKLLGEDAALKRQTAQPEEVSTKVEKGLLVQRARYPSEGGILAPAIVLRAQTAAGKLPVVVMFSRAGKESLLEEEGPASPTQLARDGFLVALPDVRCFGKLLSTGSKDDNSQRGAWERNGIVWGRPVPAMACTDIRGVLDGLSSRDDADMGRVELRSRNSGGLAIAAVFAAALDDRITSIDADFAGCCFQKRNLPLVPFVLWHGDVLHWAALLAERKLTIRNVPAEAGSPQWLSAVFAAAGNAHGLKIEAAGE